MQKDLNHWPPNYMPGALYLLSYYHWPRPSEGNCTTCIERHTTTVSRPYFYVAVLPLFTSVFGSCKGGYWGNTAWSTKKYWVLDLFGGLNTGVFISSAGQVPSLDWILHAVCDTSRNLSMSIRDPITCPFPGAVSRDLRRRSRGCVIGPAQYNSVHCKCTCSTETWSEQRLSAASTIYCRH